MPSVSELNDRFAIKGQLEFHEGEGGLNVIAIRNQYASAKVLLQGAQLIEWAPLNEPPVIWLSKAATFTPGKSVRGGAPLCWPWFGPHATESAFPAHGFARNAEWRLESTATLEDGRTRLILSLPDNPAMQHYWTHHTSLECRITIGATLELELVTKNMQDSTVTISEALHTYFEVGDVTQVKLYGLEDTEYLDKVGGGQRKIQTGPVTINLEVDRIYLDTRAECIIEDPVLQRRIHINKRGSNSTVVWNPWIEKANRLGDMGENGYLRMLCVESANAAENTITIAPGEVHHLWVGYRIERKG
jgi:glucose-6-phosphate 1-epimerase